jgi:hypothetical protein
MSGVERVVRRLQQVGDYKCCVSGGHRHDPERKPACRRDGCDHDAECYTAEGRQHDGGAFTYDSTAVGPGQHEERNDKQRQLTFRTPHEPAERECRKQRYGYERKVGKCLCTPVLSNETHADEHNH